MNEENKTGNGANGAAKPTPYQNLHELDAHFNGIAEKLTNMAAKATGDLNTEIDGRIATAKLLRHQVIGLVAGRLADFETKQAARKRGAEAFAAFTSVIQTAAKKSGCSIINTLQNLFQPNSRKAPIEPQSG
jgi:hypothetical protein